MEKGLIKKVFQVILLLLGVGLLIFGVVSGETTVVMRKAVQICLECIGIG